MAIRPKKLLTVVSKDTKTYNPTYEQVSNLNFLKEGNNLKVIASAGTGKSSSLRYFASEMPEKNFLVLCFNAANAKESNAHPDRPSNIYYSTIHSIAYRTIITPKFRKKLSFLSWSDIPMDELASIVEDLSNTSTEKNKFTLSNKVSRLILDCVQFYCRSDKNSLFDFARNFFTVSSVVEESGIDNLSPRQIDILSNLTVNYWMLLINEDNSATISHDVYLKLYQLLNKKITIFIDSDTKTEVQIDILCLDEAQDTNPVSEDIFTMQGHLQRVLIGDPMQQLYLWRGAGNTMNRFNNFATGTLTKSFRFNESIANMANTMLTTANSSISVIGAGTKTEINSVAHLCRTNASVVKAISSYANEGKKIYTNIVLNDVFSKLFHMQSCFFNEKPKYPNKDLKHITNKETLLAGFAISEELVRLDRLRQNLENLGTLYNVKKSLEKSIVASPSDADIVVTTIHASKGLEYNLVRIDEDFINVESGELITDEAVETILKQNESLLCLLFVAVTRAEVEVELPYYLRKYFS